ncbi:sigma-70 family RNA polymerase sigma factor [Stieleria sp. JC731]|uniref:RNA polymerase sigma factor n=1 Tax=Pirellulaceae TaxID=2691357 RepID=UPI001E313299|nr:sigma-70 family RNA polymerase sigma factor [Stieleria sp. JC731]MCC9602845.1 sigma-70 family RNA polymerase sigma factor [Stieleria sp. JC731]
MEPETRESLIARLPDHADTAAWQEFVQLYEPLIYGIGRRHGLQPSDATDLVQEVLIAVAQSVEKFEPNEQRGRFRSWLFRVARNQSLNRLRQLRGHVQPVGGTESLQRLADVQATCSAEQEFAIAFRRRAFRWAARKVRTTVRPETWEAFSRTAIECQSPRTVANDLNIDVGAVYLARSRVMSHLKRLVQDVSGDLVEQLSETSVRQTSNVGESQ